MTEDKRQFTLTRTSAAAISWTTVEQGLRHLGFAPEPEPKHSPRSYRAAQLLTAIEEAVPTINDSDTAELVKDLCQRVTLYRDGPPKVATDTAARPMAAPPLTYTQLQEAGCFDEKPATVQAPKGNPYAVDETELARRLHRPAGGSDNFGRAWTVAPDSPVGLDTRKRLASETFARELAALEPPKVRTLAAVLDLLTFASREKLI